MRAAARCLPALVAAVVGVASVGVGVGCARRTAAPAPEQTATQTATPASTPSLEPLASFDATFAGARGHRRVLALVSPN